MDVRTEGILNKLLTVDLCKSASTLNLIENHEIGLDHDDVGEAIQVLNYLSVFDDENSKNSFITIAALLWEHGSKEYKGLRDTLIVLLARIGYAPSSVILDDTYTQDERFDSLSSIFLQWGTIINQKNFEVSVNGVSFVLTDFQRNIWNAIDSRKVVGISAPTSAGKSFVLGLKSAQMVIENHCDIVYIVPTLSLVNQVTEDYIHIFEKLNYSEFEILNTYNKDLKSETIQQVFILTQERAIASFSMKENPFDKPIILIVDEIQNIERVSSESSEMRSKILLDTIYEFRFSENIKHAIFSGPRISEIDSLSVGLFGDQSNCSISTDVSPVLNVTYGIRKSGSNFYFQQYCSLFEKPKKVKIDTSSNIPGYGKKRYTDDFLDYLVSFINSLGSTSQNIIFSPTANQARKTALALCAEVFPQEKYRSLAQYLRETVHENYLLADSVERGVAYHHGSLPSHARKTIEKAMSSKLLTNIACTTTLMQGVNLPAQNIIIRNPHLYITKREGSADLSSYEMANLRGRAGRLLKDFIGRTYVLDEDEFIDSSDEYEQETLFENTYKELDSSYEGIFDTHRGEIKQALAEQISSDELSSSYRHIVIYVRQRLLQYGKNAKERLDAIGIHLSESDITKTLDSLKSLEVPNEICIKNRYWDPLVLNKLYSDKHLPSIPTRIGEQGINDTLRHLLGYLRDDARYSSFFSSRIPKMYHESKMLQMYCDYAIKWAKGLPLKILLDSPYHNNNPENIEKTITLLQNSISFDLPVLLHPIYDIKTTDAVFLTFIEAGAYLPITRKLIEIGTPRETALYLTKEFLLDFDCSSEQLYERIRAELKRVVGDIPYWMQVQIAFLL